MEEEKKNLEKKYNSTEVERDEFKKELEDLKIEKNNLEEKYNSMIKENEKYFKLYHEQVELNSVSMTPLFLFF